jgi:hypothetical protein
MSIIFTPITLSCLQRRMYLFRSFVSENFYISFLNYFLLCQMAYSSQPKLFFNICIIFIAKDNPIFVLIKTTIWLCFYKISHFIKT